MVTFDEQINKFMKSLHFCISMYISGFLFFVFFLVKILPRYYLQEQLHGGGRASRGTSAACAFVGNIRCLCILLMHMHVHFLMQMHDKTYIYRYIYKIYKKSHMTHFL